jgi:hypothetical protein
LDKNKKLPQDERGTKVSLLKGKPGQGENLGQKQEITPRRTGNKCESIERQTRTRRKPWAKTRNYPKMNGEQMLVCRKAYELLRKEYCMNSDNLGNLDRAGGCPWELRQVSLPKL